MNAYSHDLIEWKVDKEPLYKSGDNPSGIDKAYAHKVSIIKGDKHYYMYYCAVADAGVSKNARGIALIIGSVVHFQWGK